jgi:hypothetical protein
MAKWPNLFISGKQFQKRPNWADLALKKAKLGGFGLKKGQMATLA